MKSLSRVVAALALSAALTGILVAQQDQSAAPPRAKVYWGDEVPAGWTGKWSPDLLTVPERTNYTRTTNTQQLHEWIAALKLRTENLHVIRMFTSPLRKVAPAMVLANPRVTSPQQARASGKPVVFLLGNIHPPEAEAAEAMLMVARDLGAGKRKHILDNVIVMIAPIYNVDGTDTYVTQDAGLGSETPHILGVRENSQGLDLNRDAVKLTTVEGNGLYNTLNSWDPVLDMAQPMANAAFYYLEPQARDGFVGWGVMDDVLRALGAAERPVVYPVFKVRRLALY